MEFSFTKRQEQFREEVRNFISLSPPERFTCEIEDEGYGFGGWSSEYSRLLGKTKWLGIPWSKEYGGLNGSLMDWFIMKDEMAYHRVPVMATFFNDSVGLSLMAHGTEGQKKVFLPKIAAGEVFFCTALSEPNAGSDLLSLRTAAIEKGDRFIINGQKIWSTGAHLSHWTLAVVRTDSQAPRHLGISTIIVDMKTPGITVRPIVDMTDSKSFCEIFFDDVSVPKENLLGQTNRGMLQILESLEGDRFWGRCVKAAGCRRTLEELVDYAKESGLNRKPEVRNMLAEMATEIEISLLYSYWVIWLLDRGKTLTHEACIVKTFADEFGQRFSNMGVKILSLSGFLEAINNSKWGKLKRRLIHEHLFSFGTLIAGGTPEIQRNTIALRGLSLPKK
jgi:3-oxocholest-4-en-26-oyl-CoA dehydrogenase alpha subunit